MTSFAISGRAIGANQPPYLIAELSGNHNNDIGRAFDIMAAAKAAGADAVKLQTYTADTLTIDCDRPDFLVKDGPWGGRRLHDLYQQAHTPWEWHAPLFAKARDLGITIFSTPFDTTALALLEDLQSPAYKIASFEVVDLRLIEAVAAKGKPIIMSVGMATFEEIEEAVAVARHAGCENPVLLHCVSAYPADPTEANLANIPELARRFGVVSGLSDHTLGVEVATGAVALGAAVIEKHMTLRRADGGVDSAFSLEPQEFAQLVRSARIVHSAIGGVCDGPKPSERGSLVFRRSLYVVQNVRAGDVLTDDNVRSIRPGYGLAPKYFDQVLGKRASRDIMRGEALVWSMVAES